jgi:extradiol dioxygenase family protein
LASPGGTDGFVFVPRRRHCHIDFILPPKLRFARQPGEQWTMFF